MARKAIVDKDIILNMLREGETTQRIADKFSVSRQAIDLYRRNFIEKGLLPDQRAVRTKKTKKESATNKQNLTSLKEASPSKGIITLDDQIDLIIDAFNALKRLPHLEREVEKYKQEYESALKEIERLRDNEKKRLDQESRWLLSQHQNGTDTA
jgi:transposase